MCKTWMRNCPKCDEEITYTTKRAKDNAEKHNTKCGSCAQSGKNNPMFGKKFSKEIRKKMSESHTGIIPSKEARERMSKSKLGDKNPAKRFDVRKKISESCKGENHPNFGKKRSKETRKMISESNKGKVSWNKGKTNVYSEESLKKMRKPKSEEAKKNMRISAIKRIEKRVGQISPNYNSDACGIINDYNKKYGFNFRHAENGGEKCIDGYYPDGIDEKRKTIIEIDELYHFDTNGKLKQKDIQRQRYLEGLGYKFIRIKFEGVIK